MGNRYIGRVKTCGHRSVGGAKAISRTSRLENLCPDEPITGNVEMDSHADTFVLGKNFIILHYTGRICDVYPYTDSYEGITGVQIVTGATAWTCPETGETFILVIPEALWMPEKMSHSLVNPNQLRAYGSRVQDNPFDGRMTLSDPEENLTVPMHLEGTNIVFSTRTPSQFELDNCQHIQLASHHEWDPSSLHISSVGSHGNHHVDRIDEGIEVEGEIYNPDAFSRRLLAACNVRCIPKKRSVQEVLTDVQSPPNFTTESRRADITPQSLADKWMIGLEQAKLTLKSTSQRYLRSALLPLSRRYKADRIFQYPRLYGEWYTDTVFGPKKSKNGNDCGQIFANGSYFATFYPMDSKGKAGDALRVFCKEFGVPDTLRHDGAKEMCKKNTEFQAQVRRHDISTHISEPDLHNQSPAEGVVREVRRKWYRVMFKKRVPTIFWDYGMRWVCETMQRTHLRANRIDGGVPLQKVTGETVDISNYIEFGFYDWVWFRDNAGLGEQQLGRWLGVAENIGSIMTYYILKSNGETVARSTVWNITNLEKETDEVKTKFDAFDSELSRCIKNDEFPVDGHKPDPEMWADLKKNDEDFREEFFRIYQDDSIPESDDVTQEPSPELADDTLLRMELALPRDGDGPELARVKRRKKDSDGNPIGRAHQNPILDTRVFEVEFIDGHTAPMTANAISENLFSQVDQEGHRLLMMDEIVDHRRGSDALKEEDAFVKSANGEKRRKQTTKGWELLLRWKDGLESWTPLKDMKECFPVETAEYAVQSKINEEPAFAWWVPIVIKKRAMILSKIKSKYWQRTHKYGIEIPKSIEHARKIDEKNGNTLWWDAICAEMATFRVAFEPIEEDGIPRGHKHIDCHMIFDVKLGENYRRKARFVAGGHQTGAPSSITYASVVSRDSVRICLLLAALNGLEVLACDIKGAYLTAPVREKIVTTAGAEFGPEWEGKTLKIVKALYGLKSAGAAFRAHLAEHLHSMSYRPSYADPDVWLRPAVKLNGEEYYEYLLAYCDDILAISMVHQKTMLQIKRKFELKNNKFDAPETYLGANLSLMENEYGFPCWTQSADKYLAASVENVEAKLKEKGRQGLPSAKQCRTPFVSNYRPELDTTPELKLGGHRYFQELIGVLRWGIEIGRLDILLEVSMLSSYLACPREGHLEAAFHIFGYLKHHNKRKIAFDPSHPKIDERRFKKYDWTDFYRDAVEAIPPNAPRPRGQAVSTHCFVDANLAGNSVTRRSQMGILLFVNKAPILWLSKKTNTVEVSTFGSEIVALRHAVELIESLRYKLRMFGVPLEGPTNVFCDNQAVTKNCSTPESTIQKKHHSINYHRNREAVASGTIRIAYEDRKTNLADAFTHILDAKTRNGLFDCFMY